MLLYFTAIPWRLVRSLPPELMKILARAPSLCLPWIYSREIAGKSTMLIYRVSFPAEIPTNWQRPGHMIALHLDLSSPPTSEMLNTVEGLLYIDGKPFHALDRYHREIILTPELSVKNKLAITVRLWTGINKEVQTVGKMELRLIDEGAYRLHCLMALTVDTIENLSEQSPFYLALGSALEETCFQLDFQQRYFFFFLHLVPAGFKSVERPTRAALLAFRLKIRADGMATKCYSNRARAY